MKYLKAYNLRALPEKKDRISRNFPKHLPFYLGEDKSSGIWFINSRFFDRKSQYVLVDSLRVIKNNRVTVFHNTVGSIEN